MIKKFNKKKISHKAFTLIEMTIVLVIMGIMLMATVYMSGEQIQKVKDKSVKEAILTETQTRYARNLGSSSYEGEMYKTMEITFVTGENKIDFKYNAKSNEENNKQNSFTDKFIIKNIITNYNDNQTRSDAGNITLKYTPYKISCEIGNSDEIQNKNVAFIFSINNNKDYCFEIQQKNCRLTEISEPKCNQLKNQLEIN